MSVKTIKTKRRLLYAVYRNLKSIPPKEFATTEEIKTTIEDILPEIEEPVEKFNSIIKRAEDINFKLSDGTFTPEQTKERVNKLNEEWKVYNDVHGDDVITIRFESQALKILRDQFDKWGKNWFQSIEEFVDFSNDLEKKKKKAEKEEKEEKEEEEEEEEDEEEDEEEPEKKEKRGGGDKK